MRGRFHISKLAPPDLRASIPYFEQAIELDPGYALAYTGLSQAYGVLGITGELTPAEAFTKARAAEQKAIELDDGLGEAHISMCMGKFWYDWDWRSAEASCVRALEIDPNNGDFHGYYAQVLSSLGRHDEALAHARRAGELNPLNLGQGAIHGQQLLYAGRVDEALIQLRKTSELEPKFWMPYLIATSAYIEKGMYHEAIAESRKELELTGGRINFPFGIYALAKAGRTEEARVELAKLLTSSATKNVSPYNIALIYNGLGDVKNSVDWLEKGYSGRDPKMTFLKVEPKWNGMRQDPRFLDLMKRMNFPL
jgi:serine/threonine-protein kinase